MTAKLILFRSQAREKILHGAAQLADAVRITLGPKSKSVLIQKKWGTPLVCNDGVTIAKETELEDPVEDLGALSLAANDPQNISSVCAVLAESEIINHVSSGAKIENIIRGIHNSLASRSKGLLSRVGLEPEVTFVGGVARQSGMVQALQETLGVPVNVNESPDTVVALGAALLAWQRYQKLQGSPAQPAAANSSRDAAKALRN